MVVATRNLRQIRYNKLFTNILCNNTKQKNVMHVAQDFLQHGYIYSKDAEYMTKVIRKYRESVNV